MNHPNRGTSAGIRRQILFLVLAFMGWKLMPVAYADDVSDAKARLNRQIQLIELMEPYVERPDLGRLFVLKGASRKVLQAIEEKGPFSRNTFNGFQNLIVAYRYSVSFFKEIETARTKDLIVELRGINTKIEEAHGFDTSPYTQITTSTFRQMHELTLQLLKLPLPEKVKTDLEELNIPIGQLLVMSQADGDRPNTFNAAIPLVEKIRKLYPAFNDISASDGAYYIVLEIQGLNEFYGEYAQVEKSKKK